MVWLKICDIHLTSKVANKCLNVLLLSCQLSVFVKENPDRKKKKKDVQFFIWQGGGRKSYIGEIYQKYFFIWKVLSRKIRFFIATQFSLLFYWFLVFSIIPPRVGPYNELFTFLVNYTNRKRTIHAINHKYGGACWQTHKELGLQLILVTFKRVC